MRNFLIVAAVAWGGLTAASAVQAMPISGYEANLAKTSAIQVDYACGHGWHEGEDGDCRPNYWRHGPPRDDWRGGPRGDWGGGPPRWHHHWDGGDDDGWRHPHRNW